MVALFIHVVLASALVNYGLYQVDPKQFSAEFEPSLGTFFYYAFSAALAGEINGFVPRGDWAISMHMGTGFSAAVLLLVLVVSLIFGVKQSRTDEASLMAITALRQVSEKFESRLAQDYGMQRDGLRDRLVELESVFGKFLAYLAHELGATAHNRK